MNTTRSRPNVLLITVDAMRSDFALGDFGSEKPFFQVLEREGTAFDTMIAAASSTTPAVASYMTGTYPPDHGILSLRDFTLNDTSTTLAEVFNAAGYETLGQVCGPLTPDTGLDAGFDTYHYRETEASIYTDWFDEFLTQLGETPGPWFAYLHLWEPHIPRITPPDADPSDNSYDASIRGVAEQLAQVLDVVDLEETVIAVTGDHGESIYDGTLRNKAAVILLRQLPIPFTDMRTDDLRTRVYDRFLRHRGIETEEVYNSLRRFSGVEYPSALHRWGHGYHVYDFLVRVPFIIAGADVPNRGRVSDQVRQVDIFPTLLAAAGLEPPHAIDGQDLFAASYRHRPAMMRAVSAFDSEEKWLDGVRYDGWKFVKGRGRALRQLFNLGSDPFELDNVVDEYPEKAAELEAILDEFVAREDSTREGPSEEAKRRMTERLEHLGYL